MDSIFGPPPDLSDHAGWLIRSLRSSAEAALVWLDNTGPSAWTQGSGKQLPAKVLVEWLIDHERRAPMTPTQRELFVRCVREAMPLAAPTAEKPAPGSLPPLYQVTPEIHAQQRMTVLCLFKEFDPDGWKMAQFQAAGRGLVLIDEPLIKQASEHPSLSPNTLVWWASSEERLLKRKPWIQAWEQPKRLWELDQMVRWMESQGQSSEALRRRFFVDRMESLHDNHRNHQAMWEWGLELLADSPFAHEEHPTLKLPWMHAMVARYPSLLHHLLKQPQSVLEQVGSTGLTLWDTVAFPALRESYIHTWAPKKDVAKLMKVLPLDLGSEKGLLWMKHQPNWLSSLADATLLSRPDAWLGNAEAQSKGTSERLFSLARDLMTSDSKRPALETMVRLAQAWTAAPHLVAPDAQAALIAAQRLVKILGAPEEMDLSALTEAVVPESVPSKAWVDGAQEAFRYAVSGLDSTTIDRCKAAVRSVVLDLSFATVETTPRKPRL